jgi:chloride channel protein, CIC family
VLGTGYGWIQHALGPTLSSMPLWIVLILPFARILATGLSIGSGGSGGVFGPGMVIGAFVGAAVWRLFEPAFPWMGNDPTPYVIVGMMCCFGSIARAPLAVMLMVAEMTGSIGSIEPGIVAVGLAWLIVSRGEQTMYRSQLTSRAADDRPPPGPGVGATPTRPANAPF